MTDKQTVATPQASDMPMEMVVRLTEMDVRGELALEQAMTLRTEGLLEAWKSALTQLQKTAEARLSVLKTEMLQQQQAYMRMGPSGKGKWFDYKAKQDIKISREIRWLAAIAAKSSEAKILVKKLHIKDAAQLEADVRMKMGGMVLDMLPTLDNAGAKRVIERLASAIAPLASLDHLLPTTAHDDTHLAAYKAVRLKVSDIRAARAAWMEAQAFIGSVVAKDDDQP